jgi:hypothetical protein
MLEPGDPEAGALLIFRRLGRAPSRDGPLGHLAQLPRDRDSALQTLELPRREATIVQTVAPDLRSRAESPQHTPQRPPLGRRGRSKFKLELHLAESDPTPADRTVLASAGAADHAMRLGRRQSAGLYCCSSLVSQERLVERGSEPRLASPVRAQCVAPATGTSDGRRAEIPAAPMLPPGSMRLNAGSISV